MADVTKAIMQSKRTDVLDGYFGRVRTAPVGYDVFHIVGHTVIGDEVYLVLGNSGWVRSKEALIERQQRQDNG